MKRRKAFKTIGSIVPFWRAPIISTIALPAHAQTSALEFESGIFVSEYEDVCINIEVKDDSIFIQAKFSTFSDIENYFIQGDVEIPFEQMNDRIRIELLTDCNGREETNPIDAIVIEQYSKSEIIFGIHVEKYLGGRKAYPGICVFDQALCPA